MTSHAHRLALLGMVVVALGACGSNSSDSAATERTTTSVETTTDTGASTSGTAAREPYKDAVEEPVSIEIEMQDFGYEPAELTVPAGVPVRFLFTNTGKVEHEVMIATAHMQEELARGSHGDHHHGDGDDEMPSMTLAPGASGTLELTFDAPGQLVLGCHLPGHWEAGMRSTLTVS